MYITVDIIIKAAALLGAVGGIWAVVYKTIKWLQKQDEKSKEIEDIKQELCLLTYGLLACLKGLKEQGCNGPVTEAVNKIEKHLNQRAHDV